MKRPDPEETLRRHTPPSASDALRDRVLPLARRAVSATPAPSLADHIWYSRGWRLAWVASFAIALLVEWMAAGGLRSAASHHRSSSAETIGEADAAALSLGLRPGRWIGHRVGGPGDDRGNWSQLLDEEETP